MKKIIISIILLFTISSAYSSPVDSLWVQANKAYIEGNYAEASEKYEDILALDFESPDIYFNLGNAYYKQNMIGQSILNYERALRLSPENVDVIHNLEMARLMQLDKIEAVPEFVLSKWYNSVLQIASADAWGIFSIVLFAVFLVLLMVYFFTWSYGLRKLSFFTSILAFILCIITLVFALQQRAGLLDDSKAIVFAPVVTVKSSPDVNGTDLFIIHEGMKIKIIDHIGDWNRIVLSDGNQGWASAASMQII
ncbi:MAG: tetratricopeptide repeat protein [Prevotellaceae bacterium]|jgi:tetratricopeptide (TPR) repeat protein|nr:tetratricopeptide repeat protein [Prevotellaceae bacterium]